MATLYTNALRAKALLEHGQLPEMMDVPEESLDVIDPDFVPGYGALTEDEEKGLRCPVRGCGEWKKRLGLHLNRTHEDLGGERVIREKLSLPEGISLTCTTTRGEYRKNGEKADRRSFKEPAPEGRRCTAETNKGHQCPNFVWRGAEDRCFFHDEGEEAERIRREGKKKAVSSSRSVMSRNDSNCCDVQIVQRILLLEERLGRTPTAREARKLDKGLVAACYRWFGSWNAALAASNLKVNHSMNGFTRYDGAPDVARMFETWYEEHGYLPYSTEAEAIPPRLPNPDTVKKYMRADTWKDAMRRVAIRLGVYDKRYRPVPEEETP